MINLTNIAEDETFEIPFNDINEVLKMVRKLEKLGINVVKNELKEQRIDDDKINKLLSIINIKGDAQQKILQLNRLVFVSSFFPPFSSFCY